MNYLERLVERYPALDGMKDTIEEAFQIMKASYENGGKLLVCGNGGSASDSDHIVGELMKGFYKKRPLSEAEKEKSGGLSEHLQGALPAISLAGHPALSTNVLNAVRVAKGKGMKVIGFTGHDGGALKALCDVCLIVPSSVTADIQEYHLPVYHTLCAMLEEHFFPAA